MKIEYDKKVDAAYISLHDDISSDVFGYTYPCDPLEVHGEISLDFDKNGKLIGIEVMDASKKLPEELLRTARIIGKKIS